jgi:deoxyuridine 5''-triphosphate nucleotidohydrolase (dut)
MICRFVVDKGASLPAYQTELAAGADVRAFLPEGEVVIKAGEYKRIPTGLRAEIPAGYEIQVRPRSGLAFKYGITVLNAPGTIDADYRGEIGVLLINHGKSDFTVSNGDRIAQFVFAKVEIPKFELADQLGSTARLNGGFGSTGV